MEEILSRTARFGELVASKQAFVDTRIPEHERDIFNVIGQGVTEDPDLKPAIVAVEQFNITYIGADPGKGAALHAHSTVEVFIPMSGRWSSTGATKEIRRSSSTPGTSSPSPCM